MIASMNAEDIERFVIAQGVEYAGYAQALAEIQGGRKYDHWIWYIFPQLRALGRSHNARFYGIADRTEAAAYLAHPLLGARLREISRALLEHSGKSAVSILGHIDALKVCSCMTLFDYLAPNDVFAEVLAAFYEGQRCPLTLELLGE